MENVQTKNFKFILGDEEVEVKADKVSIDREHDQRYIATRNGEVVAYFHRSWSVYQTG